LTYTLDNGDGSLRELGNVPDQGYRESQVGIAGVELRKRRLCEDGCVSTFIVSILISSREKHTP
jgi:hypothetical protein